MKQLFNWLDQRTGYRGMARAVLYEHIPGGARWRYVWGSTLVFTFAIQMITGFFLWMSYSPSSQTAWESVYYIQHVMAGGWLLRGIHHYAAQVMIVLLALHMMQVIIDGAYRAPREFNFWIGLILLILVLGLGLTGYLLPWDQKGYWATGVATSIMGIVPGIGAALQRILIGGPEYGHHTLTRFFALHAGLLPFLMICFIAVHIYLFRRHGIRHKEPKAGADAYFWVDQLLKDAVACLAVLGVILVLCIQPGFFGAGFSDPGRLGAELTAPADPGQNYSAARPEWYFLFLFQFLKLPAFQGENEIFGAVVIPAAVMLLLALMPLVGRWKLGHRFNIAVFSALLIGIAYLTIDAVIEDVRSQDYRAAVAQAKRDAERVLVLASAPTGIPVTGAVTLLRDDAYTQGPRLFQEHCASCHRYDGHNGLGAVPDPDREPQSAPDLKGFASRQWLEGLLDPERVDSMHYFGGTKFKDGKMVRFVKEDVAEYTSEQRQMLKKVIAALSAEAQLISQREIDARDVADIEEGRKLLVAGLEISCIDCHTFREAEDSTTAPELTGYGSRQWLIDFIGDPSHKRFYGRRNDRMPAFGAKGILDQRSIGFIVDWLRGEWYDPGRPAPASPSPAPASQVAEN